jgi:hypothetical protein
MVKYISLRINWPKAYVEFFIKFFYCGQFVMTVSQLDIISQ